VIPTAMSVGSCYQVSTFIKFIMGATNKFFKDTEINMSIILFDLMSKYPALQKSHKTTEINKLHKTSTRIHTHNKRLHSVLTVLPS